MSSSEGMRFGEGGGRCLRDLRDFVVLVDFDALDFEDFVVLDFGGCLLGGFDFFALDLGVLYSLKRLSVSTNISSQAILHPFPLYAEAIKSTPLLTHHHLDQHNPYNGISHPTTHRSHSTQYISHETTPCTSHTRS